MAKKILFATVLTVLLAASCKESPKQESNETAKTEAAKEAADEIVKSSLTDKDGKTLEMTFNNTKNTATISLNSGERIELAGQKPASGIWYKNDRYELRGKGEKVELTKDGQTIFKN